MLEKAELMEKPTEKKTIAPDRGRTGISPRLLNAGCVVIFAAASAYAFRGVWNPFNTIEGADASLWVPMFVHKWTEGLLVPRWFPHFLAGITQQFQFLSQSLPLMLTLPPHRFHGFAFMLDTFLAGAFMFAFLRSRRIGHFGALVGGLSFQLGNSLLTNAAQGGLWKFDTACWTPLFLLFFIRILDDDPRRVRNCVFAGATLGMQFLGGEVQLAYYVCLLALAYFAFDTTDQLWRSRKVEFFSEPLKSAGRRFLMAALCTVVGIVFASEVLFSYVSFARGNENVGVRTEEDNWRFATEFSFPPGETLALALSGGIFGEGVDSRTVQGRPIVRITDDYMGIVAVMFAFMALLSGRRRAFFFGCAAVVALVISFGRFFPLFYKAIYLLPAMKGLRNPHKWLFITAVCVPVLAGMGADYWKNAPASENRKIVAAITLIAALMVVLAFLSLAITGTPSVVQRPMRILFLVSIACLLGRIRPIRDSRSGQTVLPLIIVALLAGDLLGNASKFIKYYDYRPQYMEDNVVKWLRSQPGPFRVKLWSESPYLRDIATEVFPYCGIDTVDAIMSRRPGRYSDIFQAARDGRLSFEKLFQLFNTKYILSATALGSIDIPMSLAATFGSGSSMGNCYVYEMDDFLPRVYMVNRFEALDQSAVIDAIGNPDFDLHRGVVLEKRPGLAKETGEGPPEWSLKDLSFSPHRVHMHIEVDRPALLVLQDFMDERWRAHIDTEETEILRANYLMRAIAVPSGKHRILFTYRPPVRGYVLTLAGWIALSLFILAGLVRMAIDRFR